MFFLVLNIIKMILKVLYGFYTYVVLKIDDNMEYIIEMLYAMNNWFKNLYYFLSFGSETVKLTVTQKPFSDL